MATAYTSTSVRTIYFFPVSMRAAPVVESTNTAGHFIFYSNNVGYQFTNLVLSTASTVLIEMEGAPTTTTGYSGWVRTNNASSKLAVSAEL